MDLGSLLSSCATLLAHAALLGTDCSVAWSIASGPSGGAVPSTSTSPSPPPVITFVPLRVYVAVVHMRQHAMQHASYDMHTRAASSVTNLVGSVDH